MLQPQSHLFQLPEGAHFLNCAYMSPLLRSAEEAGLRGLIRKRNPSTLSAEDFFTEARQTRELFARMIGADANAIALLPSASHGLSAAVSNLPATAGTHCLIIGEEFPSGYYSLSDWCRKNNKTITVIPSQPAREWNQALLDAIQPDTIAVLMSSVHWTNGTLYDLKAIGEKCSSTGTWFIVDGTQSVGALPLSVSEYKIDALVCAAYKWLLGPYSTGLAYFGERYNQGQPIEQSWMNRSNALNFATLTDYVQEYSPGAGRYNGGQFSNFIAVPMLNAALSQLLDWGVSSIQEYCTQLSKPLVNTLREKEYILEEDAFRCGHITGFKLPSRVNADALLQSFRQKNISVSLRGGNSIRVSPHLYNTQEDIEALIACLP